MDGKVAIVGLGAIGSMALWRSSLRSGGVVGFESAYPGYDRTGIGGDSRLFRMAYRESPSFAPLLVQSEALWHELNRESGAVVLEQCGGLSVGDAAGDYMRGLIESVQQVNTPHEMLSAQQLGERFPQHALLENDIGLYDPMGGLLRTDIAVLSAVEQAQAHGATVLTNTKIDRLVPKDGAVELWSGDRSWTFEKVVIASGAWAKELLPEQYAHNVTPGRVLLSWFCARNPDEFTSDKFPVFVRDSGGIHMYGGPTVDGATVKVAGVNAASMIPDVAGMQREFTVEELEKSNDAVRRFLPGLFPACVRADAYPDLFSDDRRPLIGWLPQLAGVYLASGFSARGFKMASGVGELIAREIIAGETVPEAEFVRPGRFL